MSAAPIAAVAAAAGLDIDARSARRLGGGSINAAWRCDTPAGALFVKTNAAARYEMFAAEALGLEELGAGPGPRVPRVIGHGIAGTYAWLALEYIDLMAGDDTVAAALGAQLAQLHARRGAHFGWQRDNTIGTTPQVNTPGDDWPRFFAQHRLGYQLRLARERGAVRLAAAGERLCERIGSFFRGAGFEPCLVHGDLWGGNWAAAGDAPVIFDPAVYYGDPETDIAMSELFGGFPPAFYAAYRERIPERHGDATRRELYRLYHVLNHYNLFGGGYAAQAEAIVERLLARA